MDSYSALLETAYETVRSGKSAMTYNVFKVLGVSEREVYLCRILADLLNPMGLHGKGDEYLKAFLEDVLDMPDAGEICRTARVYKEYLIDAERRIDVVIVSAKAFIPIEVKINAGDQPAQCYDYCKFARTKDAKAKIVYLTVWGTEPSEYSLHSKDGQDGLSPEDYVCISFTEDIIEWLNTLLENEAGGAMQSLLAQYKNTIEGFTGKLDEGVEMRIVEKIRASEDNFRGMLAISSAADRAKASLMYDLLAEMDKAMSKLEAKYNLERESRFNWYEYRDQATQDYYKQRDSTYPGINYRFKEVSLPGDVQLWLRVEVDYTLFFGLCLFDPHADSENGNQCDEPSDELKEHLKQYIDESYASYSYWWVASWFLPTGAEEPDAEHDLVPNFKSMNEAAVALSDNAKREAFVRLSLSVMDEKLSAILKSRPCIKRSIHTS